MQFTWAFLVALVSVAAAAPTKRQSDCPLQNLSGLTIVTSADSGAHTRWDVFGTPTNWFSQAILAGSLGRARAERGVRGPTRLPIESVHVLAQGYRGADRRLWFAAGLQQHLGGDFQGYCSAGCNAFAGDNDLAADGCTFELTDGTNGVGQCASFAATNSAVALTPCDGSLGQSSKIFGA
ncbi:hypothetical protein B0H17DRAFT_1183186 [Mycena rosella]|uniref:Uncharacterized protein n=1 Tax=Mycena rosella TaxID=1033263 RepID=A0AAD7D124_MYCRO|nr:hypothetical protein B0H17DRAFT_1183186 [Mycena rosella]